MKQAVSPHDVQDFASRLLKVNHAGENGAVNIYSAQIFMARLTAPAIVAQLIEFRCHEVSHRAIFWQELQRRNQPRCRSYHLCGIGGFVLGLLTGALGCRAIAATTTGVERVVLRHLEDQHRMLGGRDAAAEQAIESILADERRHHDVSNSQVDCERSWAAVLRPIVSACTEAVIWIGIRA